MTTYMFGLLAVVLTTAASVAGMVLVRKKVGLEKLVTYHEVAGYLLSVVGTLYAVLLGFIIVEAMQHMQDLRLLVEQEASGVANIFLVSNGLPSAEQKHIQGLCEDYTNAVVNEEWASMESGAYSQKAFLSAWGLWNTITSYEPNTAKQQNTHAQLLSEMCSMTEHRRARLVNAAHGLAPIMWYVLIVGGIFTVIFTYFFGLTHLRAQVIMTALVALTLSLNLFVLYMLSNPFSGDLAVTPDAFRLDMAIFKHHDAGSMPPAGETLRNLMH